MPAKKKKLLDSLKDFYRLYTSGLNPQEIERLLKRESLDVFTYYRRDSVGEGGTVQEQSGFPLKQLRLVKDIFLSFVMKLTPARRLFYGVAVILFIAAAFKSSWLYAFLAFLLINVLLAFELADKMLAKDELEIAREIQMGLQPAKGCSVSGLEISAYYNPSREVGGDYYDFFTLPDDRFVVIVGDVSGKGLPAALYAVRLQGIIELLSRRSSSPREMLIGINEIMSERLRKTYFITAAIAIFDMRTRSLRLARAGHSPPLYYKTSSREALWLKPDGIGIGLDRNSVFDETIAEKKLSLSTDDLLLFYTDGVTEAMNPARAEFGEARLRELVAANAGLPTDEIRDRLVSGLNAFVQKPLLDDDVTAVVVKFTA